MDAWPHIPLSSLPPVGAQNWCIKRRSQSIYLQVLTDKHAPEHYRYAWASSPPCGCGGSRQGWEGTAGVQWPLEPTLCGFLP